MRTTRSTGRGFTLLEILVVLLVIGVLAGMIVPGIGAGRSKAQLREASQQLWQAARFTQQRALLRGVDHRLVLLPEGMVGGPGFRVEMVGADATAEDGYALLTDGAFKPTRFAPGVTYGPIEIGGASLSLDGRRVIGFRAAGDADAAAVVLLGVSGDRALAHTVLVSPNSGRVERVEAWVDQPPNDREDLDA